MAHKKNSTGFTLIESMIVVAIIGILAAVAIPNYKNFVYKGRRAEAQSMLLAAQLAQEKHRLRSSAYYLATELGTITPPTGLLGDCGSACTSNFYNLSIPSGDGSNYTLQASVNTQSAQKDDTTCQVITLTADGASAPDACWSK